LANFPKYLGLQLGSLNKRCQFFNTNGAWIRFHGLPRLISAKVTKSMGVIDTVFISSDEFRINQFKEARTGYLAQ
jgi:hypothetical protein